MPFIRGVVGDFELTVVPRKGNVPTRRPARDVRKGDRLLVVTRDGKKRRYARVEEVRIAKEPVYRYQIQQFGQALLVVGTSPPPFLTNGQSKRVVVRGVPFDLLGRPEAVGSAYVYNFKLEPLDDQYYVDGVVYLEPL